MPIYGELGRYPLSITIKQRMICYCTRILKINQHKLKAVPHVTIATLKAIVDDETSTISSTISLRVAGPLIRSCMISYITFIAKIFIRQAGLNVLIQFFKIMA